MYNKATFAHSLKSLLEKRGMTQRTLAEKLETTEVTVSRYTSGQRTPNVETTVAIAEVLNSTGLKTGWNVTPFMSRSRAQPTSNPGNRASSPISSSASGRHGPGTRKPATAAI